jgi:hypothetical protein
MLVKASLELPAFSTLDEIASRIRREVNTAMFERVAGRIGLPDRVRLENLLEIVGPAATTPYNRFKQPARRASWSGFRERVEHLRWVDSLGDTDAWLEGIAEAKIADFAGEAMAADAAVMRNVTPLKRLALLACMVHVARTQARDDLAEMFCKRMAQVTKLAKAELAEICEHQAEMSERLITNYRSVLGCLDPRGVEAPDAAAALRLARRMVEDAGGFEAQLADIEAVSAHHANTTCPWSPGTAGVTARRCSRSCEPGSWTPRALITASLTPSGTRWRTRTPRATSSPIMSAAVGLICRSPPSSGSGSSSIAAIRDS